jgi:hypothetical protein
MTRFLDALDASMGWLPVACGFFALAGVTVGSFPLLAVFLLAVAFGLTVGAGVVFVMALFLGGK